MKKFTAMDFYADGDNRDYEWNTVKQGWLRIAVPDANPQQP